MKLQSVLFTILCFSFIKSQEDERSFLDNFIVPFRVFRKNIFGQLNVGKQTSRLLTKNNKMQPQIPKSVPFPCDLKNSRSPQRPKTVHELRPGDIDIIAAIGDSLTAGVGATATNVLEVALEERGKSFSCGGERSWREYLTIPNILKVFNPNLVGYSLNTSLTIEPGSVFNVAESGAISANTPYMTRELLRRIKSDRRIDINRDWKMVTLHMGTNDFCSDICYIKDPEASTERHRRDMLQVLRLLRDNLPKTIVNVLPLANLRFLINSPVRLWCPFAQLIECSCLSGSRFEHRLEEFQKIINSWQKVILEMGDNNEFDLEDFTVVVQPFFVNYTFPTPFIKREVDTYLSEDCFHWSQKLHAKVANDLWNNIMEPVGYKSWDGNDLYEKFICPDEQHPYIFTKRNSRTVR